MAGLPWRVPAAACMACPLLQAHSNVNEQCKCKHVAPNFCCGSLLRVLLGSACSPAKSPLWHVDAAVPGIPDAMNA